MLWLWSRLAERGAIYRGSHTGWYSVADETFYPDSRITATVCPKTGASLNVGDSLHVPACLKGPVVDID